jgi:hypothetical protein
MSLIAAEIARDLLRSSSLSKTPLAAAMPAVHGAGVTEGAWAEQDVIIDDALSLLDPADVATIIESPAVLAPHHRLA